MAVLSGSVSPFLPGCPSKGLRLGLQNAGHKPEASQLPLADTPRTIEDLSTRSIYPNPWAWPRLRRVVFHRALDVTSLKTGPRPSRGFEDALKLVAAPPKPQLHPGDSIRPDQCTTLRTTASYPHANFLNAASAFLNPKPSLGHKPETLQKAAPKLGDHVLCLLVLGTLGFCCYGREHPSE